jgi:hypothetical protein
MVGSTLVGLRDYLTLKSSLIIYDIKGMAVRMVSSLSTNTSFIDPSLTIIIRMQAYDLGLHRGSDRWKIGNRSLFSPEELQARKQLWWACNRADK